MKVERLKEIPLTNAELAKIRSPHPYKAHETLRLLATIDARDSEIARLSKIEERFKTWADAGGVDAMDAIHVLTGEIQ